MFRIHWFSVTIFDKPERMNYLWSEFFSQLGLLVAGKSGGRGYYLISHALLGAKLYSAPVTNPELNHYHIEIPGQACDALSPHVFPTFLSWLKGMELSYQVKRVDLAFDNCPFTPSDFLQCIVDGKAVTLAKRETLKFYNHPFEVSEDGQHLGNSGCVIGSNESQRMVTVYDKRGFTRLEFQMRDDRAHAVVHDLFKNTYEDWQLVALSHLRQYIDMVKTDWWAEFVSGIDRADLKISSARLITREKMWSWIRGQVAVAMSVLYDIDEDADEHLQQIMLHARLERDRSPYKSVLQLRKPVDYE